MRIVCKRLVVHTLVLFWSSILLIATVVAKDPYHTAEAPLPAVQAAGSMVLPEGFRATLFAAEPDVKQPIGFCLDDAGRLWVAEAYNYPQHGDTPGDRIIILEDSDGDGRMDRRKVFYDGLNYVTGIEVGFGGAWVMSPPSMYFIPDADGDDVPDDAPQVLLDGFGTHANAHNLANGFAWGPDGWLYGTHGRTNWSMIGKPGTPEDERERFDGGVYRYHPTRHVWQPYADGTTNPWGIDWNDVGDAFVCNCVNPHLFQVIRGAHYEPWRGRQSSEFAYQRIDTIADHLHFVGLGNVRNGLGSTAEDEAGGGHAHCGTMIYLGDQFPDSYRNQLFTNNIHGRRINNDLLRRSGSGYIASHGPDLMRSKDPWYMGVTLATGPAGEVYASDWSDTGECHSTRNTRKETGRIYRISYLQTQFDPVDLRHWDDQKLVDLQLHENDWMVRHARRRLQERAAAGEPMDQVHQSLWTMYRGQTSAAKQLRAMWALWVTGGLAERDLQGMLASEHEEVRQWAIHLLCEDDRISRRTVARLTDVARSDPSPRVRLALASSMQQMSATDRWPLATALAAHGEDVDDPNLPLMYWYGIEPLVDDEVAAMAKLAVSASIPRLRINASRRIAESDQQQVGLKLLADELARCESAVTASDVASGILLGLQGRRHVDMPSGWSAAYSHLIGFDDAELSERAVRLALVFRDQQAIDSLRAAAQNRTAKPQVRQRAIKALVASGEAGYGRELLSLIDDPQVRAAAIGGLAQYQADGTAETLIRVYRSLPAPEKQTAIETLSARPGWAHRLLAAVAAGAIPKQDITAFNARQLRSLESEPIMNQLHALWGEVRPTSADRARQISRLKSWLDQETLAESDLALGKALFTKHCATCHQFFGEGGKVGPDITGAQRNNLDYLLENIVDPNASVSRDYRMHKIVTVDGRVITGLVESENDSAINLLTATDRVVIPRDELESRSESEVSIMPSGLLDNLSEREIRDLVGYLQRT